MGGLNAVVACQIPATLGDCRVNQQMGYLSVSLLLKINIFKKQKNISTISLQLPYKSLVQVFKNKGQSFHTDIRYESWLHLFCSNFLLIHLGK